MLIKMRRTALRNENDIWNAMVALLANYDFPTENKTANKVFIVYNFYSELESGGHEALFNWSSEFIEVMGAENYFKELIGILEEINAHDYSLIEKKYGERLWELYKALENDEIPEEEFLHLIEKADTEYEQLSGKLGDILNTYFIAIYEELIELVD